MNPKDSNFTRKRVKTLFFCGGYASGISAVGADASEKQLLSLKTQILPAIQAKPLFLCGGNVSGISAAGADTSEKQLLSLKTQILPAVQAKPLFLCEGDVGADTCDKQKSSPSGELFLFPRSICQEQNR